MAAVSMADVVIDTDPDSPLENGCAPAWSQRHVPPHMADLVAGDELWI